MSVPTRRILEPIYAEASLADANDGNATWVRGQVSPLDQKGQTGWLACLYGGIQSGDDWARVNIPVFEQRIPDFNSAQWTWQQTNAEVYGVNIVIFAHDPNEPDNRVEITQAPSHADLDKAAGWNSHVLSKTATQFFYYGENVSGSGLTSGTQYTWNQFQTDVVFETWTIYRITFDWGWYSTGTFEEVYVGEIKLNGMPIYLRPDSGGTGRIGHRRYTVSDTAAHTLAPKTPFRLLSIDAEIASAGTTSESLSITKDSGIDDAYDTLLYTVNTLTGSTTGGAITDLFVPFGEGYDFEAVDELDMAWGNTEDREFGFTWTYQTVFGG